MKGRRPMDELPVLQGLLICERIVTDPRTRNLTFFNRFATFRLPRIPSPPRNFAVFAGLTNGFGEFTFRLWVESLRTEVLIAQAVQTIQFTDRLQDVRIVANLSDVVFPHAGAYQITLYAEDEPLTRRVLQIIPQFGGTQ
jgi:hypothetical protein